jgi:hypothetical protein
MTEGQGTGLVPDPEPLEDGEDSTPQSAAFRFGVWVGNAAVWLFAILAIVLVLGVLGLGAFALFDAFPTSSEVAAKENPSWLDTVFASRSVVFAARAVLLATAVVLSFLALLIVATVVVRINRRQWLQRVWMFEFEPSEAQSAVSEEAEWAYERLAEALSRNEELEHLLEERDAELESIFEALGAREERERNEEGEDKDPDA